MKERIGMSPDQRLEVFVRAEHAAAMERVACAAAEFGAANTSLTILEVLAEKAGIVLPKREDGA